MIIDEPDYLEHFGVKGMKWGVRNEDRPGSSKQARREKKAHKFVTKANILDTKISEIDVRIAKSRFRKSSLSDQRQGLVNDRARALSDADKKRQGKLSSNQKKVVVGASVAAATLAAYGAYRYSTSGEMNRNMLQGKAFLQGNKSSVWKKNAKLADPNMSADDILNNVVKQVNPGYGQRGTKMNCRRATFAYEMRRRGHDVSATKTLQGNGQTGAGVFNVLERNAGEKFAPTSRFGLVKELAGDKVRSIRGKPVDNSYVESLTNRPSGLRNIIVPSSPGFAIDSKGSATAIAADAKGDMGMGIFRALRDEPNGARGELGVQWDVGGAHSMAWEVVNGRPVVFDAQSGKKLADSKEFLEAVSKAGGIKTAGYTRLDNVPMNEDFLMRWLKDAK